MLCKRCDYRLWNLESRRCPECGTPFRPSEYEFEPNTVQFLCPHCKQAYYGTGGKGHLVPATFDCAACHRGIDMDDMVLLPAEGYEEEQTEVEKLPWLQRQRLGVAKAWFRTAWMTLIRPQHAAKLVPRSGMAFEAWGFAIVTNTLVAILGVGPFVLLSVGIGLMFGGGGVGGVSGILTMLVVFLIALVGTVVFTALIVGLWACVTHGLLRLTGKTSGTLGNTVQAICYSTGANASSAVPCIGTYFGWIWWVVSAVLMVKQSQKVGGGRAAFSVVTLPALVLLSSAGFYGWFMYTTFSGTGPFYLTNSTTSAETQNVTGAILRHFGDNGIFPAHAIELVSPNGLFGMDFISWSTDTAGSDVPVLSIDLEQLDQLSTSKQQPHIITTAAALPKHVTAHRLGDYVFTYHDIDPAADDPGLWIVIASSDPDHNVAPGYLLPSVGLLDGSVASIPIAAFAEKLAEQNRLRAAAGLPPLPDPSLVTHDRPAIPESPE